MKNTNALAVICCAVCCLVFCCRLSGQEKKILLIGRTSGSFLPGDGRAIRIFGYTARLGETPGLPGPVLEAQEGDSLDIDFWNVSQGDPHDLLIKGITLHKENQRLAKDADKSIRHMEHGSSKLVASPAGTYIYYCPVNYPFNIQAGMSGILIIRPKQKDKLLQKPMLHERLWCSFEMDSTWHSDSILDVERGEQARLAERLSYQPQYFLINGKTNGQLADPAVMLCAKKGETLLLRLANTGFMDHRITFPKELELHVQTKNTVVFKNAEAATTLVLKPMETCEVIVKPHAALNGWISYSFENEAQDKVLNVQKIPVVITGQ